MRRRLRCPAVPLALLLLAAAPGFATAPPATPSAGLRADAVALAELVSPHDLFVSQVVRGGREAFLALGSGDSELAALERLHPGLIDAVWTAVAPEFTSYGEKLLPAHRAGLAGLYRARLTPAEVAAVHIFFSSDTGKKLVRQMYTANVQPVIDELIAAPGEDVSAGSYDRVQRSIIDQATRSLSKADATALEQLTRTVCLSKMGELGAEVERVSLELINQRDPAFEARIGKIAAAAMNRFVSKGKRSQ